MIFCLTFFLVDITVYHRGYHGDLNETFLIGDVGETAKSLTTVTWQCLQKAIEIGMDVKYRCYCLFVP